MHGHDFLVIAEGQGVFNESVLDNAHLNNPTRRDVVTIPASPQGAAVPGGYVVVAFQLNNPGVWVNRFKLNLMNQVIHCHIAFHLSMGLGFQFVERIDEIPGNVGVTSAWQQNCQNWDAYDIKKTPREDDSGL
jgi:FtsP/CotA-like multicopper oxidase with cupredoxin domain